MSSSAIDADPTPQSTEGDALVQEIARLVADAEEVALTDLPPLYDTVDPEALARIRGMDVRAEFVYCGYRVVLREDGEVEVEAGAEATD